MRRQESLSALFVLVKNLIQKTVFNRKFLLVICLMIFVSAVMGYSTTQDIDRLELGSTILDILVISFFLPIVTMIFGSSVLRDEIDDKSITQVLASPLSRVKIFLAFYISTVLVSIFSMWLIVTSGSFTYFGLTSIDSDALHIYLNIGILTTIGCFVYSSLFFFVSVLIRRAIYFGLFYIFVWEGFIGTLPGNIKLLSIRHYLRSIEKEWVSYGPAAAYYDASELVLSFEVLVLVTAVLLTAGAFLFRKKEFP